jgi:hypothetical protein
LVCIQNKQAGVDVLLRPTAVLQAMLPEMHKGYKYPMLIFLHRHLLCAYSALPLFNNLANVVEHPLLFIAG